MDTHRDFWIAGTGYCQGGCGMAILDRLSEMGKNAARRSGELAESSRLSLSIKKEEKEIRTVKADIGEYIYQRYQEGAVFDDTVMSFCRSIDANRSEILRLQSEKESIGIDEMDIEVLNAEVSEDDFDTISEEEKEILEDLQ